MQYAYITVTGKRGGVRSFKYTKEQYGKDLLYIITTGLSPKRVAKKIKALKIDRVICNIPIPGAEVYSGEKMYKYFAPGIFRRLFSKKLIISADRTEDIFYLVNALKTEKITFAAYRPPASAAAEVLKNTGIPLITADFAENCTVISFNGILPPCGDKVNIADFKGDLPVDDIEYKCLRMELGTEEFKNYEKRLTKSDKLCTI